MCTIVPRELADLAARWISWAIEDLTLAEHAAADDGVVPRGACAWAHQAAEKAVKALLIARGLDPPKLHDLDRLVARLPDDDARHFDPVDLPELTRWATAGRYPDDLDDAHRADAWRAVVLAREVVSAARAVLGLGPSADRIG